MPIPSFTALAALTAASNLGSFAGMTFDSHGNLFGTTYGGGANGYGTVFELAKTATGYASAATTLLSFQDNSAGVHPSAVLTVDSHGNLFGTTAYTSPNPFQSNVYLGGGAAFELRLTATGYVTPPVALASFTQYEDAIVHAGAHDYVPWGMNTGLVADSQGNLFGTTLGGGANGFGSVFEIAKTATGYASRTTLASFSGSNGQSPLAGSLMIDSQGNLFGTTQNGGANNHGTVFEIAKTATGYAAAPTSLAGFPNAPDYPTAGLVADSQGNLYGVSQHMVFEIAKTATGYATTPDMLYNYGYGHTLNQSGLLIDAAGNLFGTGFNMGAQGRAAVFELSGPGHHTLTVLHTFDDADGSSFTWLLGTLVADAAGNLYGTTQSGTIFEITDSGFVVPLPAADASGVVRTTSDATFLDASFAAAHNLTSLVLNGTGAQGVTLGAAAEAAFTNGSISVYARTASSFTVDGSALDSASSLKLFAYTGVVSHFTGGAGPNTFTYDTSTFDAAGRTANGGSGATTVAVHLTSAFTVQDADFAGLSNLGNFTFNGTGLAHVTLGATALAAFSGHVSLLAQPGTDLVVDGSALGAGFRADGGNGGDTFIGGTGNDTFIGGAGVDEFDLGQGGKDMITGFDPLHDQISLAGWAVHSFAALAPYIATVGGKTVITLDATHQVQLTAVLSASLTASDFIFT